MNARNVGMAGALVCAIIAIAIGVIAWQNVQASRVDSTRDPYVIANLLGTPLDPPKAADDATLRDGAGRPAHVVDGATRTTLVFFGYTHCPDECPIALASLGHAYRLLDPRARARTRIVFVTVDPVRDTPPVIARYVRAFDPHIVGLTGDAQTLARVRDSFGVRVDAQSHEISHGTTVFAVDSTRQVRLVYPPDTTAKEFAHDLALLGA